MGSTQKHISKEYPVTLPSGELPIGIPAIAIRKLRTRDQTIAAARFDPTKQASRYGTELFRLCTIAVGSCTEENPDGIPAFDDDGVQDMIAEDLEYISEAVTALNKMGAYAIKYKFDF